MEITKYCNIFSAAAEAAHISLDFGLFKSDVNRSIEKYKRKHGGLWVGGKFTISNEEFRFSTNTANQIVHKENCDLSFPMSDVKSIYREFGWITGILNFELDDRIIAVRCFGAKKIAARLNKFYTE